MLYLELVYLHHVEMTDQQVLYQLEEIHQLKKKPGEEMCCIVFYYVSTYMSIHRVFSTEQML